MGKLRLLGITFSTDNTPHGWVIVGMVRFPRSGYFPPPPGEIKIFHGTRRVAGWGNRLVALYPDTYPVDLWTMKAKSR